MQLLQWKEACATLDGKDPPDRKARIFYKQNITPYCTILKVLCDLEAFKPSLRPTGFLSNVRQDRLSSYAICVELVLRAL
jgi:hypothetical protein